MFDILNDAAMDGNLAETPGMDAREGEKADTLQPESSIEEGVQGSTVDGASQASRSRSQLANKSCVTWRMDSIKDSTSVLAIANYVEMRRTNVNRKVLKIDKTMEYGQSRVIG